MPHASPIIILSSILSLLSVEQGSFDSGEENGKISCCLNEEEIETFCKIVCVAKIGDEGVELGVYTSLSKGVGVSEEGPGAICVVSVSEVGVREAVGT